MEIIPNGIKIVAPENMLYKNFKTALQDERDSTSREKKKEI
jgi:hypothetical protein